MSKELEASRELDRVALVERYLYSPGRVTDMRELFLNPRAVEAFADYVRPVLDAEFEVVRSTPFWGRGGRVGGLDEWLALYTESMEMFNVFRVVVEELIETGDDGVLALARCEIRTATGDVDLDQPTGALVTVRDGRILRIQEFMNRPEALEAAGLSA
jgi:ketosteroid isomerase-like protein